jgi:putative endonuclease
VAEDAAGVWFCYMVRCADRSFYVGIATDVEQRVQRHNWGAGPAFTARRRPVELVWFERCGSSDAARCREKEIKGWSRAKKLRLINERTGVWRVNPSNPPLAGSQGKGE